MSFGDKNINPLDLNPSKAIGINLPLNGGGVFTPNFLTKDALKNNLINFLLTNPGERYMNPNFGAGMRDYIFSQIESGNLDFIKEDLEEKIKAFFPNISLNQIEIFQSLSENTITISFNYSIINTNLDDEITISFT